MRVIEVYPFTLVCKLVPKHARTSQLHNFLKQILVRTVETRPR